MIASSTLLHKKYAKIVSCYANKYSINPEIALDRFYRSNLYQLISTGVSDLHCMSYEYLAEELYNEWSMSKNYNIVFNGIIDNRAVIRFISKDDLNLSIVRIVFYDLQKTRIIAKNPNCIGVFIRDGYCERKIDLPSQKTITALQFIVKDKTNQEQHSVTIHINEKIECRRMIYGE